MRLVEHNLLRQGAQHKELQWNQEVSRLRSENQRWSDAYTEIKDDLQEAEKGKEFGVILEEELKVRQIETAGRMTAERMTAA